MGTKRNIVHSLETAKMLKRPSYTTLGNHKLCKIRGICKCLYAFFLGQFSLHGSPWCCCCCAFRDLARSVCLEDNSWSLYAMTSWRDTLNFWRRLVIATWPSWELFMRRGTSLLRIGLKTPRWRGSGSTATERS